MLSTGDEFFFFKPKLKVSSCKAVLKSSEAIHLTNSLSKNPGIDEPELREAI